MSAHYSNVKAIIQPGEIWQAKVIGVCREIVEGQLNGSEALDRLTKLFAEEKALKDASDKSLKEQFQIVGA